MEDQKQKRGRGVIGGKKREELEKPLFQKLFKRIKKGKAQRGLFKTKGGKDHLSEA